MHRSHPGSDALSRLMYLERNINPGSPSGYTFINKTSIATSPFGGDSKFSLPYVELDMHSVVQIGTPPSIFKANSSCGKVRIPTHPDFFDAACISLGEKLLGSGFIGLCEPTASSRTVLLRDNADLSESVFVKLHYPGKLGRFERGIWLHNWIASLEVSAELDRNSNRFPKGFAFLPEFGGYFISHVESGRPWGVIFRSTSPKPSIRSHSRNTSLIPCFSLIAKPTKNSPYVLEQYLCGNFSVDFFVNRFIDPILRTYTYLAKELGLMPELNAQNLLFEISEDDAEVRVILRDMNDVWKDLTARKSRNMHNLFSAYHSIDLITDVDFYKKRSFSYDFKLSNYILLPLCKAFCSISGAPFKSVREQIRDLARQYWGDTRKYFKEEDAWFSYPNLENVGRTFYLENKDPLFR